jgi:type I site-specific restriction endonuclease
MHAVLPVSKGDFFWRHMAYDQAGPARMNKKDLSERDICTKFITPAVKQAEWDEITQIREEVSFTKGRIIVRGKLVTRGKAKRADYVLYYKPNIPIALIEAKDNNYSVGAGLQQALDYAVTLDIPFCFFLQRRRVCLSRPHRNQSH